MNILTDVKASKYDESLTRSNVITFSLSNFIINWHTSNELSLSDSSLSQANVAINQAISSFISILSGYLLAIYIVASHTLVAAKRE